MTEALERFVQAQDPVYGTIVDELRRGRKATHWMWFVFPQLRGLGHSAIAERYEIDSLEEARAYLAHPMLGPRLHECCRLVEESVAPSAEAIFGPLDALKLRSSMTLFRSADPADRAFPAVLERYFDGQPDPLTERLLR